MGGASNLIGGMGGFEDGNDGVSALEKELLGIEDSGPQNDTSFKVTVFINMDEDDDGDKNVNTIFKIGGGEKPYNIDVSNLFIPKLKEQFF